MARACRTCPGHALPKSSQCARCGGVTRNPSAETARRALRREVNRAGSAVCAHCGVRHPASAIRIDHTVPLSAGGLDSADNVQPLCQPCHEAKSESDAVARYLGDC